MHSSRMRTVHSLPYGAGVSVQVGLVDRDPPKKRPLLSRGPLPSVDRMTDASKNITSPRLPPKIRVDGPVFRIRLSQRNF